MANQEISKLMAEATERLKKMPGNSTVSPKRLICPECRKEVQDVPNPGTYSWMFGRECESCAIASHYGGKERQRKGIGERMARAGVPKKFLADRLPLLAASLSPFVPVSLEGRGLCLTGKIGVGKTTQLATIIKTWFEKQIVASEPVRDVAGFWQFVSFPAFIMRVQDSYRNNKGEETALDLLEELASVPFLAIDDLGVEKPTDFVRQATYFIIDEREKNLRPTFITTNFPLDQLSQQIDGRIASRIAGMCDVKEIKGNDRRVVK